MGEEFHAFLVMPENARWMKTTARTHEMAYRQQCCWFSPNTRIAVMDCETRETVVYIGRENDGTPIVWD